jgi:hypothetical protein
VANADGSNPIRVIAGKFGDDSEKVMDWKPAGLGFGTKLATSVELAGSEEGGSTVRRRHIAVVDVATRETVWLTDTTAAVACQKHAAWKPNGKAILYMDDANKRGDIWSMKPNGTGKVRLTDSAGNGNACYNNPMWHPSGKYIAFWSTEGLDTSNTGSSSAQRLFIMTADGRHKLCLMTDGDVHKGVHGIWRTAFNSAGTRILFSGVESDGNKQLFVLDLDTADDDLDGVPNWEEALLGA